MPTVLIVEDNEMNREMLARRLARRGFTVETAENGEWALGVLDLLTPDVVLMDMNMPGLDGWETTRRIRQMDRLRGLPVIALTAHAAPEDRQRCLDAGCNEYHVKPVAMDDLEALIRQFIGGGHAR